MNARPTWMQISAYRACDLCLHAKADARPLCNCPAVLAEGEPQPIHQVRAPGGACGPDAQHLDMASWR